LDVKYKAVAPTIFGHDKIKRALAMQMVGGNEIEGPSNRKEKRRFARKPLMNVIKRISDYNLWTNLSSLVHDTGI
jgi:hypothetical protein